MTLDLDFGSYTTLLALVGLVTLTKTTYTYTRQATNYLRPSSLRTRYNPTSTKSNWALVTGATDGIGFGFAQELCARGFNVILHGRNREKLNMRVKELTAEFPKARFGIVVRDVTASSGDVDEVDAEIRGIIAAAGSGAEAGKLTVLVNNVGGETKPSTLLKDYSFGDIEATVARNATFCIQITRVLAAQLEESAPALVLNVSSVAAFGMPYISAYCATKGFVDSFTMSLGAEFRAEEKEVEVMALRVAEVRTAGYDVKSNLFVPEARVLAGAGLDRVGCGQEFVWAYFWHWLQGLSFDILPRWALLKIASAKLKAIKFEEDTKRKRA
jgi:short-subunit dehydrogenase